MAGAIIFAAVLLAVVAGTYADRFIQAYERRTDRLSTTTSEEG